MRPGKPMNEEITERVRLAIEDNGTVTVEKIRQWIKSKYKRVYSWNTIRKHLNNLIDDKLVEEIIISDEGRKVSVIRLTV